MKKIGAFLIAMLLLVSPVYSALEVEEVSLKSSGSVINGTEINAFSTLTTDGVIVDDNVGFMSLIVDLTPSSQLTVTYEISVDGNTWFSPVDTDLASLATISTDVVSDSWIVFTARLAKFIRFSFGTGAASVISGATLIYQKEVT